MPFDYRLSQSNAAAVMTMEANLETLKEAFSWLNLNTQDAYAHLFNASDFYDEPDGLFEARAWFASETDAALFRLIFNGRIVEK